jgi:hypothetical protein
MKDYSWEEIARRFPKGKCLWCGKPMRYNHDKCEEAKKRLSLNKGEIEMLDDGHNSDCAVHNMPAMPNEPCNCGAL